MTTERTRRDPLETWKYLVDDFLEMACFLNEKERGFLIDKINPAGPKPEKISSHLSFSISGKLIVLGGMEIEELIIYDPSLKGARRFKLTPAD